MIYTLKLFNSGQVTLPKKWREKYETKMFLAEETAEGLLLKPLQPQMQDTTVFYEDKEGFGLYCPQGLDAALILRDIAKLHGQDQ